MPRSLISSCCRSTALAGLLAVVSVGCFGRGSVSPLQRAEELTRQEKYQEAIAVYRVHIADRIEVADRPEWENPYFYLLMIGDLQLRDDHPESALESIELAERYKVEPGLISDRYRAIASWYEHRGDLSRAMEVLRRYRGRDELLFDAMLDRLAREMVLREERDRASIGEAPAPAPAPTSVPSRP